MAHNRHILRKQHYRYQDDLLFLHFPSCYAKYREHCRRIDAEGEVPDKKALRRQLRENHDHGGYVRELDKPVYLAGADRKRAVGVDLERAKTYLDVDDFPRRDDDEDEEV